MRIQLQTVEMDKKRVQKELEVLKKEIVEERDEILGKLYNNNLYRRS